MVQREQSSLPLPLTHPRYGLCCICWLAAYSAAALAISIAALCDGALFISRPTEFLALFWWRSSISLPNSSHHWPSIPVCVCMTHVHVHPHIHMYISVYACISACVHVEQVSLYIYLVVLGKSPLSHTQCICSIEKSQSSKQLPMIVLTEPMIASYGQHLAQSPHTLVACQNR